jgi:LmbE family N-acetylglucosaminyl deacetylase
MKGEVLEVRSLIMEKPEAVLEECRKVLSVQPHPDDTELGAGGLVAQLASRGARVVYVTVTDGGCGTIDESMSWEELALTRRREQKEAARILGISELIWLGYRDTEAQASPRLRDQIISLIRAQRPDLILTVDPWLTYEAHRDHREVGWAVSEAFLLSSLPNVNRADLQTGLKPHHAKYIAYYWTRKPNFYVDISAWMDLKFRAIAAHKSQFAEETLNLFRRYFQLLGRRAGYEYAEAFKILNSWALHCNVFFSTAVHLALLTQRLPSNLY